MTAEGLNLAGVETVLALEEQVEKLRAETGAAAAATRRTGNEDEAEKRS